MPSPLHFPLDWKLRIQEKEKISVVTAYDASFAYFFAQSKIDALLVGDSLAMVVQGKKSTISVSLDEMIYHAKMVRRGAHDLFLIGDMPFGTYHSQIEKALENGIRYFQEGKLNAIKLEGGQEDTLKIIKKLKSIGIPIMGHIGLTPQSYHTLNGYKVQGKKEKESILLKEQALQLQEVGCFAIVLELVQSQLSKEITDSLEIPTIGIGSGPHCAGQILVAHDLLGMSPNLKVKHAKQYAQLGSDIVEAINAYHQDIIEGKFPTKKHSFE